MTIHPEIFKKAQAEVDAIVGIERLPTMEDRDQLPYVNAICKELLRWHVVVPMRAYLHACAFLTAATLYDTTSTAHHCSGYHLRGVLHS
jgi:cytochrome P450